MSERKAGLFDRSLVAGVHILPVDVAACASGVHRLEIAAGAQRITLPITVAR